MFDISTLIVFTAATLVFLIAPGPAVIYIVARSVDQGRMAGVVSMLGINAGALVHIFAAAFGLSALLASSAIAFSAVKYAGAAYLVYLGVQKLRETDKVAPLDGNGKATLRQLFVQGFVVNIFNPKIGVFFLAFVPQFLDPARGSATAQILFLGTLFIMLAMLTDAGYALLAGTAGEWLRGNLRFLKARRYISGTILIGLGLATAVSGGSRGK